jgi:predicted nuclease of predicted toxin-antitoxin system
MRVLLDECLPRKLRHHLPDHDVTTVQEAGWAGTKNGALLRLAESRFDCFITVDQNMRYQQTLHSSGLAIIVLVAPNSRFETLLPLMNQVRAALIDLRPPTLLRIASMAADY